MIEMARRRAPKVTKAQRRFFFKGLAGAHIPFDMEQTVKGASGRSYRVDGVVQPKIVVEIDGGVHSFPRKQTADFKRDRDLREAGWTVIRFPNWEVREQLGSCVAAVKNLRKTKNHI